MKELKHHHEHYSPAKRFLYTGIIVLFIVLIFLVVNSGEAETALQFWAPFLLAAAALLIATRFVR
ncbi:MAG: hypothetical protein ACXVBJ_01005 [Flavisolibacter sp.]